MSPISRLLLCMCMFAATGTLFGCDNCRKIPDAGSQGSESAPLANAPVFERDAPGAAWLRALESKSAPTGISELGIYQLEQPNSDPARATKRMAALGFSAQATTRTRDTVTRHVDGQREFAIDSLNDMERYIDHDRYHRATVTEGGVLQADSFYLTKAASLQNLVATPAGLTLHPYKIHKYRLDHWENGALQKRHPYQVSVIFTTHLDTIPILGSGGKIAFDVDLQGSLVGYKSLLRNIGTRVGTQPIVALLSPKDAEARATQQFAARGMDPSRFTIARREFGYWLHGRSIEQKYLAPHFVFGFVSKDGNAPSVGEKVLAVTDPNLRKLLAEDEALEQKSVARLSRFASTPTERRSARN